MSYILDALKKSEQERDLGQVPTLNTKPYVNKKDKSLLPVWIGACGIFGVSVAGAFFYFDYQKSTNFPPTELIKQQSIAPMDLVKEEQTHSVTETMDILALENPRFVKHQAPPVPVTAVKPELATEADVPVKKAVTGKVIMATENIEQPIAEVVESNIETEQVAFIEIPTVDELSTSLRQRIPDLALNVHVYDDEPAERFILMNMKRYKEGEQTREGLFLEEILPNGVVMSLNGTLFRVMNQ